MAENKLNKYNSKRNFDVTNEPEGRVKKTGQRLKFSVQHHAARSDHYDLRLELGGVALSWAVPKGPSFCTSDKRLAMRVEDHPVDYMQFEGTIPKGEYGGGTVMLWDEGEWTPRVNPEKGLKDGSLKFNLDGQRLKGDWALVKIKNAEGGGDAWLLIKERDEYAKKTAGISRFTRGVRSGRSMAEISLSGATNPFSQAEVMLAELCQTLPAGKGWIYELKYDGHRTLGFCQKGKTTLYTRNGHNCTKSFLPVAEALTELLKNRAAVVDGEMVVAGDGGVPDFGALQAYIKNKKGGLNYVIFDLLALDGEDLRSRPLVERKKKLNALLQNAPSILTYSGHTAKMTKRDIEAVKSRGIEGIVAKRSDSAYVAGKNGDWKKLKFRNAREFVIGGFSQSDPGVLRSLLVGYYEDGKLKFAGRVGTGFTENDRSEIKMKLSAHIRKTPPFESLPDQFKQGAVWVKPILAVQVDYAEITSSGLLRQASFKGIRRDKRAAEIGDERPKSTKKEETEVNGIRLTSPEKTMFSDPIITKLSLAEYYAAAAERMLPFIKDRLLSLVCCPSGIDGQKFFRRHLDGEFAGIKRVPAGDDEYFYVTGAKGIITLVQYNAVEFHVWGSRKHSPYRPDIMVFDLDPDEGLPLSIIRRGVRQLKEVLDGLGLKSFLKTSGGKGYHVVVPFRTGADGQSFRDFSRQVAILLENAYPNRYTANIAKKVRGGKIFIDWQRNSSGATSVAPYSVRARRGACVSMPIAWEELSGVAPASVTIGAALRRLQRPDPWAGFFTVKATQYLKFDKVKSDV